ncbi:MAG: cytochrome c biogenesis protein CcsA [Verrucomicrobiae bacterium]|nr:cytochrome c biogenesis protein CcsA [Verrucomicrobiae bacterium]
MTDRYFFATATACIALSLVVTVSQQRRHFAQAHKVRYGLMLAGFVFMSVFLFVRASEIRRCPLTNLFEAMAFISWTVSLIYLLIGGAYRNTLLGVFTAPVLLMLNLFALIAPFDVPPKGPAPGFWIDLHAPLAVMSYGAFAVAAIEAAMFLLQENQIKRHQSGPWMQLLPSVSEIGVMTFRLLFLGTSLLAVGVTTGFVAGWDRGWAVFDFKTGWSLCVLMAYALLTTLIFRRKLRPRWGAWAVIGLFLFVILTFWGVYQLSQLHQ